MAIAIEVYGLKETLRELQKYQPELYKEISQQFRDGAAPLLQSVGKDYPYKPLKNWHETNKRVGKSRLPPYTQAKAQKGLVATFKTTRRYDGILRIEQKDGGAQVYDTAGGRTLNQFVKNLDKRSPTKSKPSKNRSRYLFTSVEANLNLIEDQIQEAIDKTDKLIQIRIVGG